MNETELIPRHEGQELPPALATLPRGDLLLPYQAKANALMGESALTVIDKSRRVGLTWGVAAEAVLVAASARGDGGMNVFYTTYNLSLTREFIDTCAMWAKAFGMALTAVDEFLFDDLDEHGHTKQIKAFRIDFASGFFIMALPSSPRSLRGRQGWVIVDEAAFVDDLAETLKAALALLIWGGRVTIISTHNGVDNPFNQLIDDIEAGRRKGAHYQITLRDAFAQGFYERICLVKGETPTEQGKRDFEQSIRDFYGDAAEEELDCIPKAGVGSWLDPADIAACEHNDAAKPELYGKGLVVIGRDVARRRDLAVIWAFELVGHELWLRERWEERKASFAAQDAAFDRMFGDYRVLRAFIDQTGMGEKVVEDQIAKKGDRVQGVLFTGANRLDMAIALKKRVQEHTIRIPPDPAIRVDLRAIKKTKGAGDTVRLANDDTVHADMFWAAALACLAADLDQPECHGYRGAPPPRGKFEEPRRGDWRRAAPVKCACVPMNR
jgi:phage FluMu gp28-like protein